MAENTTPETAKTEAVKADVKETPTKATPAATPEPVKAEEPKKLSEAELKAMFDSLPEMFQTAVKEVNDAIDVHNGKVEDIKAAEAQNPTLIKAEIYEQNTKGNKKLAALLKQEQQLQEQIEAIRKQAYDIIETDGLMPKELTEAEVEKLKNETGESIKELRQKVSALEAMENMMPMLKGKVLPLIGEIQTRRGTGKSAGTTKSGEGPKRIRFKRIEINNEVEDKNGNKVFGLVNGEEKYTFTFASAFLRKQHKQIGWTANDMTDSYLKGLDENNLPETHTFVMPFTYKDANGNDQTVNYSVKCFR